jgi:predicted HicB family RNase H-like nuclease
MTQALSTQIQLRTTQENKEWVKRQADAAERSVNYLLHKMLTEARLAAQVQQQ